MQKLTLTLGNTVNPASMNRDKIAAKARVLAQSLLLPAGIEFAAFEHGGVNFALSAHIVVEVEALPGRVPDHIIKEGGLKVPPRRKRRFAS